jgi:NADPH-dependent 2,4-dienoyl-CoA reductase/sulfur reductase-like enzyme/nitrite reductase/ring-hydroxylating ferredoxin subunit
MSEAQKPVGPDLAIGVPLTAFPESNLLAGHVGDENVLLARAGGTVYAVGAACTHYSAPLADGLIRGTRIRCPWHHAEFDLTTGACTRPPALGDLPRWKVELRDDLVRVTGKIDAPVADRPRILSHVTPPKSVVIVGAGATGTVAAKTLREEGYDGSITMIEPDADEPVDRPNLSKDYLAGNAPEEWIPLRAPEFFAEARIDFRRGRRATALDTAARKLTLDDGSTLPYDALLIASGAAPIKLPIPTHPARPLMLLRTLADSRAIVRAAEGKKSAVVIGASFIGLEVAAALRARGLAVRVVAPETRPLERVLGPELGAFIQRLHEKHGVEFRLGTKPRETTATGVILESGEALPADLIVAGVGVRPNLELAEKAGLAVDRGITVDERLRASASGVFAAGDVARYPDPRTGDRIRVEHWVFAERMGQYVGRSMLGETARFEAVPFFWSAHYEVTINYVGHAETWDRITVDGDLNAADCTVSYQQGERTLAVATIGRDRTSLEAEARMEREAATEPRAAPATR